MHFATLLAVAAAGLGALAAPTYGGNQTMDLSEIDALNLLLLGKHMAIEAYDQSLANYTAEEVVQAGFPPGLYENLITINREQKEQRDFISEVILAKGGKPYKPAKYAFPVSSAPASVGFLIVIKQTTVAVELGAIRFLKDPDLTTHIAAIATVDARHSTSLRLAVGRTVTSGGIDTAISPSGALQLLNEFVKELAPGDAPLPVEPNAALLFVCEASTNTTVPKPLIMEIPQGSKTPLNGSDIFAVFLQGKDRIYSPVTVGPDTYTLPALPREVRGSSYLALAAGNNGPIFAGPVEVEVAGDGSYAVAQCGEF
ncbi:MAG: hypothetical protein M1823_004430 [Watsoniomyces obsoletus]|nr:MAG: hypothetical protein M1823_004430 [Watsoniomyces obsoletus]